MGVADGARDENTTSGNCQNDMFQFFGFATLYQPVNPSQNHAQPEAGALRTIGELRLLHSNDLAALATDETVNYPLPDTQLLALHAAICKVRRMAGMSKPSDMDKHDPKPPFITYKQHARKLAQILAHLEDKQHKGLPLRQSEDGEPTSSFVGW